MSDLKLTETGVISEGVYFAIHGISLELKDNNRFASGRNTHQVRRALIHGTEDQLVMNCENDYQGVEINGQKSGGVKLNGMVYVNGPDLALSEETRKIRSNRKPHRRALVHGTGDRLIVNYDNDYLGVEINGSGSQGIKLKGNVFINDTDILEIINGLQETVGKLMENQDALAERIKDLEIKAGLRPTRVMESWKNANKIKNRIKIRIPIV